MKYNVIFPIDKASCHFLRKDFLFLPFLIFLNLTSLQNMYIRVNLFTIYSLIRLYKKRFKIYILIYIVEILMYILIFVFVFLVPVYIERLQWETLSVKTGTTIVLPCNIKYGNPVPSTRWQYITSHFKTTVLLT